MAFSIQGFAKITKTTKINTKSGILQTTRGKKQVRCNQESDVFKWSAKDLNQKIN